jgi:hypothetical protein
MGGSEPKVNFFRTSTRPTAVTARAVINGWYTRMPDEDGAFLRRLRSVRDVDHQTALDELFIHERLTGSGNVIYEEGGTGPDFRIYRASEYFAGVEAMSLFIRDAWANEHVRHERIADELNSRLTADRWFIHFEIICLERPPSIQRLVAWVRQKIEDLRDYVPIAAPSFGAPSAVYEENGVRLDFEFIPRNADAGITGDRIVGAGPIIGGRVNSRERLQAALSRKAGGRYDLRDQPFALFVTVHDTFCDLDDVEAALYGSQYRSILPLTTSRGYDGLFGIDGVSPDGRNRRVSCIFVLMDWLPWKPEESTVYRFDNPFAHLAFPDDVVPEDFRFGEVRRDNTHIELKWRPRTPAGARSSQ